MNLQSLRSIFASTPRVGDRPRQKGKRGAFEKELAEEQDSPPERENPSKDFFEGEAEARLLTKNPTQKQSSHAKGLKVDLFA
jgi:hypothetical protein